MGAAGSPGRSCLVAVLLALVAGTRPLDAQRVLGPWEDATIAPRGVLRAGISVHFGHWSERFSSSGERESLGTDLTRDSLGPSIFPGMAALSDGLSTLVGPGSALTLGSLRTSLEVVEARVPISLEYGVTGRLGLQVLIPYVKNHVNVMAAPNLAAGAATLGLNPALSLPGAQQQNESVVTMLGSASTTLTGELDRCLGSMDPTCDTINTNRQAAIDLIALAGQTANAVAAVFGTTTVIGARYAPLAGSALQEAVNARLGQLSDDFTALLGQSQTGTWISARPVAAPLLAAADLDRLLGDPLYGINARPLSDFEHSHVGDIEIGAKLLLLDTFGSGATSPTLPRTGALRLAVAGIYRLPTGQLDLPYDFTDVGTGDRQADIELRGFADLALANRLWTSAVFRYGMQRPDELLRRIPDERGDPFPEAAREQTVSRDLGDFTELEIAPRYHPNDAFSFSALYRYRRKAEDRYTGSFDVTGIDGTPLSLDASVLGAGTDQTEQLVGLAATFSTVRGYALRESRWPLEISLTHTLVLGGRSIPRQRSTGIVLRFYRRVLAANPLRPTATRR